MKEHPRLCLATFNCQLDNLYQHGRTGVKDLTSDTISTPMGAESTISKRPDLLSGCQLTGIGRNEYRPMIAFPRGA